MVSSAPASSQRTADVRTGPLPDRQRVLIVTGMSGAGKTTALKALEDLGYESVDHVPLYLLRRLMAPTEEEPLDAHLPIAVGIDVRTRDFEVGACLDVVNRLKSEPHIDARLLFLHCDEEELRRRYSVTRHRHPLAAGQTLTDGIARERDMLEPLRTYADIAIDTTHVNPNEIKSLLQGHFPLDAQPGLTVQVVSFSFRAGLPRDADLVFDVRFLANPYYRTELAPLTGRDPAVVSFVASDPAFETFFAAMTGLLKPLLPRYLSEGKSYLTIAIGCTGGRHRSVCTAERLGRWLQEEGERVHVHHRELEGRHP